MSRALVLQHADLESSKDPQNFSRAAQEERERVLLRSLPSRSPEGSREGNKPAGRKLGFEVPDMYGSFMAGREGGEGGGRRNCGMAENMRRKEISWRTPQRLRGTVDAGDSDSNGTRRNRSYLKKNPNRMYQYRM